MTPGRYNKMWKILLRGFATPNHGRRLIPCQQRPLIWRHRMRSKLQPVVRSILMTRGILRRHAVHLIATWQVIVQYQIHILGQDRMSCRCKGSEFESRQGSPNHNLSNRTKYDRWGSAAPRSRDVSQCQRHSRRTTDQHWRRGKVLGPGTHSRCRWGFVLEIRHRQETPSPHFRSEDCRPHYRAPAGFQQWAPLLREEHTRWGATWAG